MGSLRSQTCQHGKTEKVQKRLEPVEKENDIKPSHSNCEAVEVGVISILVHHEPRHFWTYGKEEVNKILGYLNFRSKNVTDFTDP